MLLFDSLSCYTALHVFSREVHCSCVLVSFCLILAGSINLWRKNVSELTQEIWLVAEISISRSDIASQISNRNRGNRIR